MAFNMEAAIKLAANVQDAAAVRALSRDLNKLEGAAKISGSQLNRLNLDVNRMASAAGNTTAGLRRHVAALQALRDRAEIGSAAYNRLGNEIDQLKGKLRGLDGQAARSGRAIDGMGNTLRGLATAAALFASTRFVFAKTAELETQARSLQVLTGSATQAAEIISQLQQLGAVTPFTSAELIDSAKRLQAFGVEADKVVETTRRLADVSGATGAELQGLVTAYGQVQAKGRLQGEELLQFQERGVALQGELRKMYNLSGEEFTKALSKGKISAEAVEQAIVRLTEKGGKYAEGATAQSDTLSGKFSTLQDNVDQLARTIGVTLTPAIKGVLSLAIDAIGQVNTLLGAGMGASFNRRIQAVAQQLTFGARGQALDGTRSIVSEIQSAPQRRNLAGIDAQLAALDGVSNQLRRIGAEGLPDNVYQDIMRQQGAITQLRRQLQGYRQDLQALRGKSTGSTGAGDPPPLLGEDKDKKAPRSRMNDLLAENLRLNTELGNIGKDRISQLNAQIDLIPQLLKLELADITATLKGNEQAQARINAIKEARLQSVKLEEELAGVNKEIQGITGQALELRVKTLGGTLPPQSPLKQELERVKQELVDADAAAQGLLVRLSGLAGTNPAAAPARAALGQLRGDVATIDPNEVASRRLVQSDLDTLRQQTAELQNAGRQLSTLDQLVIKYGQDWDLINPKIRAQLESLASTRDALAAARQQTELWNDVINQAGTSVAGVFEGLILGTNDWTDSLRGALNALSKLALQFAISSLAGNDGVGFFSFLQGSLKFAKGGVMTDRGELPLQTYARGGIARTPQLALFGEGRQPEAYVPLPDGRRIPVAIQGGSAGGTVQQGDNIVTVNVDASGSSVEGNTQAASSLGRVIAAAVQQELIRQKRPGGLLAR